MNRGFSKTNEIVHPQLQPNQQKIAKQYLDNRAKAKGRVTIADRYETRGYNVIGCGDDRTDEEWLMDMEDYYAKEVDWRQSGKSWVETFGENWIDQPLPSTIARRKVREAERLQRWERRRVRLIRAFLKIFRL